MDVEQYKRGAGQWVKAEQMQSHPFVTGPGGGGAGRREGRESSENVGLQENKA